MRKYLQHTPTILLLILFLLPAVLIQLAAQSTFVASLTLFVQQYLLLYILALIFLKAISTVYPPLPGIVITLGSIPIIGWPLAYLADIIGTVLGGTLAFYLGNKYGHAILERFLGKHVADKITSLKLKNQNQIEASIFLRLALGGMLSDAFAWGAGLIGFKFVNFIMGYAISHMLITIPIFYLVAQSISFDYWLLVAAIIVVAWLVIYKLKGRYFE